jgi:hypothetical protein
VIARLAPSAAGAVPAPSVGGAAALALVVLAAAALLLVDVRLAASDTRSQAEVGTTRIGATVAPDPSGTRLSLHVDGDDGLTEALRRELPRAIGAVGVFAGVDVLSTPPTAADRPALVVGVASRELFWTPVYATGAVQVAFAYASDRADLSWRDDGPIVLVEEPAVRSHGRLRLSDTTRGLVSWPAYQGHLGREAAVRVAEQLRSALVTPAGGSAAAGSGNPLTRPSARSGML